ncbi:TRAP transporter substrate-binding protein DctP [Salipaludibacillus keqinensis]|nr:TRAP transporter substrate-binding protein DctP [Salipaludibacillus keqinensis]
MGRFMKESKWATLMVIGVLFVLLLSACGGNEDEANGSENSNDGNENVAAENANNENENENENANEPANDGETYTLSVVLSLDEDNPQMLSFPIFTEIVEAESDGRIQIDYVGGPEAIPPFTQGEAVQNGTVDMGWVAGSYYADVVPEVLGLSFSQLEYEEEVERGSIEYISRFHEEKMNTKAIGRAGKGNFALHVGKDIEVNSTADFEGLDIRGTANYVPVIEAVGANAIALEAGEIYSSLERGLIDGYAWTNYALPELGAQEITGSQIMPYFNEADQMILANLDVWNDLPEDLQEIITNAAIDAYLESRDMVEEILAEERIEMEEAGVQYVELEDADRFEELVEENSWAWLAERVDNIEEMEEYFKQ